LRFRTRKTAALFAFLTYFTDRAHPRESLADWFWPEADADASRQSLRMALSDIRKVVSEPGLVRADRDTVELDSTGFSVDIARFRDLSRDGAKESLAEAAELYTGPLLHGIEEEWVMPQRSVLEEEYAQAVVRLMQLYGASGEFSQGLAVGKRALAQVGDREDIHIGLIRLYSLSGAPSLAIAQYEELERRLDDEWGEQPSEAARQALEAVPQAHAPAVTTSPSAPSGRIFGRDSALDAIAGLLLDDQESRLVTLHGPAGSGKTTLAQHVAARITRFIPGRCWLVDLTTCSSVDSLPGSIASGLGIVGVEPNSQIAACAHHLSNAPSLLVLDNLEHLLPHAAGIVERILAGAPPLRVLATTRRILEIEGEFVQTVPPLALPDPEASFDEVQAAPAVQMFVARATAANPSFRLTPDNARSVVALCQHVEGLPLSISLAARQASSKSPAQILASLSLPGDHLRHAEGRNGSLAAALRWSLDLVSPEAAGCFVAVSQFRTPFTASDAEALTGGAEVHQTLSELVKSGLIECDPDGEVAEFHLFEMFKEVGRALQADRAEEISVLHFDWVRGLVARAEAPMNRALGPREADILAALDAPVPAETLGAFLLELEPWLQETDRLKPLTDVLRTAFDRMSDARLKARIGVMFILATSNVGSISEAMEAGEAVVALARKSGDEDAILRALLAHGNILKAAGDYPSAEALYQESAERSEGLGDVERLAQSYYSLGLVRYCVSDSVGSLAYHLRALEAARKGRDYRSLVRILFDTGSELVKQGEPERGLDMVEESVALAQELGIVRLEGLARWQEGEARRALGQGREAVRALVESARLVRKAGFEAGLNWIALTIAGALVIVEDWALATRFLARMTTQREADSRPLAGYELDDSTEIKERILAGMGQARFDRAWGEGARSNWAVLVSQLEALVSSWEPMHE